MNWLLLKLHAYLNAFTAIGKWWFRLKTILFRDNLSFKPGK